MLNSLKKRKSCEVKNLVITRHNLLSPPLFLQEAEPGDVLEIKLLGLSSIKTALCHAEVLPPNEGKAHFPTASQGGSLLPSPLYPGNHLYLPVYQPGAGLRLGHPLIPVQGEPLHIQAEIKVLEDFPLRRPRLENSFTLSFLACQSSAHAAYRLALGDVLAFLQCRLYCSRERALKLVQEQIHTVFYCSPNTPAVTVSVDVPKHRLKVFSCSENHVQ